jgi:hypothetical protein
MNDKRVEEFKIKEFKGQRNLAQLTAGRPQK